MKSNGTKKKVRIRGIALPNEHGAWGFLFEPLVAAVAIAPTIAAAAVCFVYVGAFLTRQPLKILLSDWLAKRDLPQTKFAARFVVSFGSLFLVGVAGSLVFGRLEYFVPLALVMPFAVYQVYCDVSRKTRQLIPELTGSVAISSSAAVIALAGGWPAASAMALWAVLAGRLIPSILYVRNRLRLEKGKDHSLPWVAVTHGLAVLATAGLTTYGLASVLTVGVFVVLLLRAILGLSAYRRKTKAMKIGILEVFYGFLTVLSIILGYYLDI